jgi:hypothetical protein
MEREKASLLDFLDPDPENCFVTGDSFSDFLKLFEIDIGWQKTSLLSGIK